MKNILSVKNMRESDRAAIEKGISEKELMKRAGEGVFGAVKWIAPVAIVCGCGNNAGDGFVIAELLFKKGIDCVLFLFSDKFSENGGFYYRECVKLGIKTRLYDDKTDFSEFKTIVDCIFGTGFKGEVTNPYKSAIEKINAAPSFVVSVDINSGLDGDNGLCDVCVRSDLTVSIGGFKSGHFLNMAKDVMKDKINCDIGITPVCEPYRLIEEEDLKGVFPKRLNFSNKGTYGYIALIGGSLEYSGAIKLAYLSNAAMRSGAGVVKTAVPRSLCESLIPHILESTLFPLSDKNDRLLFDRKELDDLCKNVKTIAFGMGVGVSSETTKILEYLLSTFEGTLVIDADGLNILSSLSKDEIRATKVSLILTPHVKEFARLLKCEVSEVLRDQITLAEKYAEETRSILLLKGPTTIITDGKRTNLVEVGCPGMATAGSGDVLSGILSATCAFVEDNFTATTVSAFINGKAGEAAQKETNAISMTAGDTVSKIPEIISRL